MTVSQSLLIWGLKVIIKITAYFTSPYTVHCLLFCPSHMPHLQMTHTLTISQLLATQQSRHKYTVDINTTARQDQKISTLTSILTWFLTCVTTLCCRQSKDVGGVSVGIVAGFKRLSYDRSQRGVRWVLVNSSTVDTTSTHTHTQWPLSLDSHITPSSLVRLVRIYETDTLGAKRLNKTKSKM